MAYSPYVALATHPSLCTVHPFSGLCNPFVCTLSPFSSVLHYTCPLAGQMTSFFVSHLEGASRRKESTMIDIDYLGS